MKGKSATQIKRGSRNRLARNRNPNEEKNWRLQTRRVAEAGESAEYQTEESQSNGEEAATRAPFIIGGERGGGGDGRAGANRSGILSGQGSAMRWRARGRRWNRYSGGTWPGRSVS